MTFRSNIVWCQRTQIKKMKNQTQPGFGKNTLHESKALCTGGFTVQQCSVTTVKRRPYLIGASFLIAFAGQPNNLLPGCACYEAWIVWVCFSFQPITPGIRTRDRHWLNFLSRWIEHRGFGFIRQTGWSDDHYFHRSSFLGKSNELKKGSKDIFRTFWELSP